MRRNALALSGALLMAMIGLTAAGCGGGQAGTSTQQPSSVDQAATTTSAAPGRPRPAKHAPEDVTKTGVTRSGPRPHTGSPGDGQSPPGGAASTATTAASPSTTTTRGSGSGSTSPPAPTGGHGGGRQVGAGHAKRPPIPSGAHGHRSRGGRSGSGGSKPPKPQG